MDSYRAGLRWCPAILLLNICNYKLSCCGWACGYVGEGEHFPVFFPRGWRVGRAVGNTEEAQPVRRSRLAKADRPHIHRPASAENSASGARRPPARSRSGFASASAGRRPDGAEWRRGRSCRHRQGAPCIGLGGRARRAMSAGGRCCRRRSSCRFQPNPRYPVGTIGARQRALLQVFAAERFVVVDFLAACAVALRDRVQTVDVKGGVPR